MLVDEIYQLLAWHAIPIHQINTWNLIDILFLFPFDLPVAALVVFSHPLLGCTYLDIEVIRTEVNNRVQMYVLLVEFICNTI